MAQLTEAEQKALDELLAKKDAPEPSSSNGSRNVDVYIDLSDEVAVKRAIGFGLLTQAEAEEEQEEEGKGKGKGKGEERPAPRRRGYFKDDEEGAAE